MSVGAGGVMAQERDDSVKQIKRRAFIYVGGAVAAALAFDLRHGVKVAEAKGGTPKEVKIVEFSSSGQRGETVTVPTIVKTDAEWKKAPSRAAFGVARKARDEQ